MIPAIVITIIAVVLAIIAISIISSILPNVGAIILGILFIIGSKYLPEQKFYEFKGLSIGLSSLVGLIGLGLIIFTLAGTVIGTFITNMLKILGLVSSGSIVGGSLVSGGRIDSTTVIILIALLLGAYFIVVKKKLKK